MDAKLPPLAAIVQMTSGIDPDANLRAIDRALGEAAKHGAAIAFLPEMSLLLDRDRQRSAAHIVREADSPWPAALQNMARRHGVWLHSGSMPLLSDDGGKRVNRSHVIGADGSIRARYDKIHMFDVDLATGESWRESNAYAPGEQVVTAETPAGRLGLAICYDLRFPALFEALGRAKCDVISIPAAFTVPTGAAHWHVMQRARAIEASAYVVCAAQVGQHQDGRETYGHSLVIDPWGEVLLDMGGTESGLGFAELDPARLAEVRAQLPSLANKRPITT